MQNRRTAIKNLFLVSAGIVMIPACFQQPAKPSIVLKNLDLTRDDEEWLTAICDTLIPATGTPGAKEIGAQLFVLKMVDDCVTKAGQQQFIKGLALFKQKAGETGNGPFLQFTPSQRLALIKTIDGKKDIPADLSFFYSTVKKYTVQAFTTSKYFLTNVHVYELIPGRFHGCVPLVKHTI